jgi:hypothetical protein
VEVILGEGLPEAVEELAAKDPTECLDMEQEVVPGLDPVSVVKRQGPAWNQTVEVEMRTEGLIPGVEHGQKTQLAAQGLWFASKNGFGRSRAGRRVSASSRQ